jgi:ABC-type sugar transport system ATPase subunit
MRRELVDLQRSLGTTTVYVTHDQTEALTMADRLVVIESGRIRQIGTVEDIYNHPADLFVAGFVGTPKINLIDGLISGGTIKPFNLSRVTVPPDYFSDEVIIGIRPEDIIIEENGHFAGTVENIEYLGDKNILTLKYLAHKITISTEPRPFSIGDIVRFNIRSGKTFIFNKETGTRFN